MTNRVLAIVMHGSGRYYLEPLLASGRLPNLETIASAGHQRYFQTALPIAAGAWVTLLTGQSVARHGTRYTVTGEGPLLAYVGAALVAHGIAPLDLRGERATLEEAFLRITAKKAGAA